MAGGEVARRALDAAAREAPSIPVGGPATLLTDLGNPEVRLALANGGRRGPRGQALALACAAAQLTNTLMRRRRRPAKAKSRPRPANSAQVGTSRTLRIPNSHTRGCVARDTALCAAESKPGAILDQCSASGVLTNAPAATERVPSSTAAMTAIRKRTPARNRKKASMGSRALRIELLRVGVPRRTAR
jgi:hypothetical protein